MREKKRERERKRKKPRNIILIIEKKLLPEGSWEGEWVT